MAIPRIETERLILREWSEDDYETYAAMCGDERVMRYMGGKAFTRLEAWRHMSYIIGHWQLRGFGHWALEEKATGRFVGRCGMQEPVGWPEFEIGWALAPALWGKGYATEAATAALDFAFETLGKEHVISLIHPENAPSIAVAERLGETREGEAEVMNIFAHIYGITRERWRARRSGAA